MLQELVQREKDQIIHYTLTGESGPDHDKRFLVQVERNGVVVGTGAGKSKKRQRAGRRGRGSQGALPPGVCGSSGAAVSGMDAFQGFSPETVDFLWGIRLNNNRDWFLAHKAQYDQTSLSAHEGALPGGVCAPFRTCPTWPVSSRESTGMPGCTRPRPIRRALWLSMRPDGLP